jgi:hypothetical protein
MKTIWFKKLWLIYLPVHIMGLLITLFAILLMVPVSITILRSAHPVSDDLYQIFVYGTCTAFWWKWVADKTSE